MYRNIQSQPIWKREDLYKLLQNWPIFKNNVIYVIFVLWKSISRHTQYAGRDIIYDFIHVKIV